MSVEDVGREGLRLAARLAGAVISAPVVAGFVALGAAVLVGRSLLDVARRTRGMVPWAAGRQREEPPREPKAA